MSDITDELYDAAVKVIAASKHPPCVATLQRKLMIGYNRAQRIMESMADKGVLKRGDHGYEKVPHDGYPEGA